jgi:PIN like domain
VKVLVDENLSPALARALDALFQDQHEVVHLRAKYGPAVTDQQWIDSLNRDGRWAVISGDRRITRNHAEYAAFRNSRLIGFFLSRGLYKAKVVKQMERILALWESMVTLANTVEGGAMFELPINGTRARQLRL